MFNPEQKAFFPSKFKDKKTQTFIFWLGGRGTWHMLAESEFPGQGSNTGPGSESVGS